MHDKRNEQRKTQPQHHDQAPTGHEQEAQPEHEGERKPSKIERREWRGAGVCGDRHTD
jgi:hypothetical protein